MSLRDVLRNKLRQTRPADEVVREILKFKVSQAGTLADVAAELSAVKDLAPGSRAQLCVERDALGAFLSAEQPVGTRAQLVAWEGSWPLDDESDVDATAFLQALLQVYVQSLSSEEGREGQP